MIKQDPLGQSVLDQIYYGYEDLNDLHNITSIVDGENSTTNIAYYENDKVNYVVKEMTIDGSLQTLITQYVYSTQNNMNTTLVTYPKGNQVKYTTNEFGNLVEKQIISASSANVLTTNLEWDQFNLKEIDNPKNYQYTFGYNEEGDVTQVSIPGDFNAVAHYNEEGDLIDSSDFAGRTNINHYNAQKRSVASASTPRFSSDLNLLTIMGIGW